jgi:uncharacterized repeat protein (TIGR01451 family)
MKKLIFFSLLFVPFLSSVQAQTLPATVEWQKTLGGTQLESANSLIPTVDHGFLVVGRSRSNDGHVSGHHGSTDSTDAWVIKLNSAGEMEWQKSYGGSNHDEFIHAVQAGNGDFICVGTTRSTDGDVSGLHSSNGVVNDLWVVRINRHGAIIWSKVYGGSAVDQGRAIRKMNDGNYLIGGDTRSNDFDVTSNQGGADIWVLKINDQGNLLWQKSFGNPNHQYVTSITVTSDDKYVISGYQLYNNWPTITGSPVYAYYEEAALKIDAQGNTMWEQFPLFKQGNPGNGNFISRILELPSHQLMKVGNTINFSMTDWPDWSFARINSVDGSPLYVGGIPTGAAQKLRSYSTGMSAGPEAVQLLSDSSIIACLTSGISGPNINLNRISTGSKAFLYQTSYSNNGELSGIIALNDDEYVAAGVINGDFWIIKIKSLNQIKGTVFVDNNGNGIKDAGESFFKGGFVESKKNGSVVTSKLGTDGSFANFVDTGSYTTTLKVNGRPYYTISPASKQTAFTTYKNKDSFSFAVTPLPNTNDLQVSLTSSGALRPGFETPFNIHYSNVGTTVSPNTVVKFVKPSTVSVLSSSVTPTSVVADTLYWNVGSLSPYDAAYIRLTLQVSPPPAVNIHDVLTFTTAIDPISGDYTPGDNADTIKGEVTGSFDPNDKQENHNSTFYIEQLQAGQPLTYTIRFQNMGTDTAFNIIVRDTLSDQLDISTLEIIGASHPYQFNLKDSKFGTFTFNNILLPDHNTNEPASHGYITYRIKPKSTLQLGDKIYNSASIYFDFNLPVQTNNHETVITPTPPPAPPQPVVSGLLLSYCGNLGVQKAKILNLPAVTSGITVTAKLDAAVLTIAADSTVSFTVSALSAGTKNLTVTYSNITATTTSTASFTVTAAVTPDVNLSANTTNVVNLANPVVVTAANASGGGKNPLYTYAWNNSFTNIAQAESSNNILNITASSLALGDNKIFVKMKTSEDCYTAQTNTDSIIIRRDMSTGITDTDNPGQVITVYPNPVNGPITISGLSAGKTYTFTIVNLQGQVVHTKRVANQSTTTISEFKGVSGVYWLTIYDEKRNRTLGSVQLIK